MFVGVPRCSWVFISVCQCSFVFVGVRRCSSVFFGVHRCSLDPSALLYKLTTTATMVGGPKEFGGTKGCYCVKCPAKLPVMCNDK